MQFGARPEAGREARSRAVHFANVLGEPRCAAVGGVEDLLGAHFRFAEEDLCFLHGRALQALAHRLCADECVLQQCLLRGEGFEVLAPRRAGDDPAALVSRFKRARGGAVLLGARTFWQGLDIPGSDLQAVVIEKLPFEVPTELRRRREDRIRQEGGDPFPRYALGKMLLHLKQMSGRLIRSEEDRGLVLIVEGRPDKRYFSRLRDAVPTPAGVKVIRADEIAGLLAEIGLPEPGGATLGL